MCVHVSKADFNPAPFNRYAVFNLDGSLAELKVCIQYMQ